MIGERISWKGANRIESGIVEQQARVWIGEGDEKVENVTYEVRLDNGKHSIVNEKSIIR